MLFPSKAPNVQSTPQPIHSIMILSRGKLVGGKPFWAYVCLKSNMAKAYAEARQRGNFDLEDYGTIIEWGEGENPPEEVQGRMKNNYGMCADYEQQLLRAIQQFS